MHKYTHDRSYYEDIYDLHTIEQCLDWYWCMTDRFVANRGELSDYSDEKFEKEVNKIASYTANVFAGERYRNKEQSITEWMEKDQKVQDFFDNATAPLNIHCKHCGGRTELISKDLFNSYEDDQFVVFMFECSKCNKRRAVHEDGREWVHEKEKCPKCGSELKNKTSYNKSKDVLTHTYTCPSCPYKKKDISDFKKSKKEREVKEKRDKQLLAKYRERFCWSNEDGEKYIEFMNLVKKMQDEEESKKKKEQDPRYQKAKQLKKTNLSQLKKLLAEALAKDNYEDLVLGKPDIGKYVIVDFSVNDSSEDRQQYDSSKGLQRLIKKTLASTNWRLMSEGVSYRLGILTGRLKAYEKDEDLMKIIG